MYANREDLASQADVDMIINLCVRSLDGADQLTRRSLARLAGHILSLTQVDYVAPAPQTTSKGKKNANQEADADDAPSPSAAAAEGIKKTMLTPPEVLHQLSAHFNRPTTSRKARVGFFDLYASLLTALGPSWVETNYSTIVTHFMTDIVAVQRNSLTRYETMLVRKLVQIILRDLIGVRMLSEQAQITAIQDLSALYLKRWPALMPGQTSPTPQVLVIILKEVAELLQQLGNTPPPVQVRLYCPSVSDNSNVVLGSLGRPSHHTPQSP
jgi:HEAT repeat-containing protein 5